MFIGIRSMEASMEAMKANVQNRQFAAKTCQKSMDLQSSILPLSYGESPRGEGVCKLKRTSSKLKRTSSLTKADFIEFKADSVEFKADFVQS